MEKYRKAGVASLWLYFIISSLTTLHEYPSIVTGQGWYLGTKILLQSTLLWLCFWYKQKPYGVMPNLLVGIHVMVSNIHGLFFSPWYVFSFVEMIIAYSFLFPLPRKHFNILLILGTLGFLGTSVFLHEQVFTWLYASTPIDLVTTMVAAAAVAWLSHHFFTADRTMREELVRRFAIVGVQTASVVHDLKSMLSAPRLYTDMLKQRISSQDQELCHLIGELEKQLLGINQAVTSLNQMVALQDQQKEAFAVREISAEVAETVGLESRRIQFEIQGDLQTLGEKALMKSIIFNIMMNSIHAFRENKITNPMIRILCDEGGFALIDNAGGYPSKVLDAISGSSFDGMGMGLFLVCNGVQSLGGKVSFANIADGAQVRISLPPIDKGGRGRKLWSLTRASQHDSESL